VTWVADFAYQKVDLKIPMGNQKKPNDAPTAVFRIKLLENMADSPI
jgi:hypothetical protein